MFLQHLAILKQPRRIVEAEFINDLLQADWKGITLNGDDINIIVDQWTKMFSLILEKHDPV